MRMRYIVNYVQYNVLYISVFNSISKIFLQYAEYTLYIIVYID